MTRCRNLSETDRASSPSRSHPSSRSLRRARLGLTNSALHEDELFQILHHVIPAGGDIVLGQEYTDFDKGLEEGVEGSVLGFNLLLASAFNTLDNSYPGTSSQPALAQLSLAEDRAEIVKRDAEAKTTRVLAPMQLTFDRDWSHKISRDDAEARDDTVISALPDHRSSVLAINDTRTEGTSPPRRQAIILDDSTDEIADLRIGAPLGLQLVKLTYVLCQLGRGSPRIGGQLMLISWSRTPVRVFGGAMMKNVGDECGKF